MGDFARIYSLVLDTYIVIAGAEETEGQFSLFEAIIPPGGGPPPHLHQWEDEAFYVLEGSVAFTINGTSPARLVFITLPGGFKKVSCRLRQDHGAPPYQTPAPVGGGIPGDSRRAPLFGLELPKDR
jgi:hypothetical protein